MPKFLVAPDGADNQGGAEWAGGSLGFAAGIRQAETVTVAAGADTLLVPLGLSAEWANAVPLVSLMEQDATFTIVAGRIITVGNVYNLSITGNAAATADTDVAYVIVSAL